jgi:hypothetical protein
MPTNMCQCSNCPFRRDPFPSYATAQRMCRCKTKSIVFHRKKNYGANVSVPVTTSGQQVLVPNHVVAVPPEVTVPDGIQTNARVNADKPGMAASDRACLRPPPRFSENPCLSYATCMHRRGGDASIPLPRPPPSLPVGEVGFPPYMDASAANCSACPNVPGNVMTGICNYNCNFDINMFLKNVKNSVSKILTEKEMVYHQRLE